jgi:hypothetical protein
VSFVIASLEAVLTKERVRMDLTIEAAVALIDGSITFNLRA